MHLAGRQNGLACPDPTAHARPTLDGELELKQSIIEKRGKLDVSHHEWGKETKKKGAHVTVDLLQKLLSPHLRNIALGRDRCGQHFEQSDAPFSGCPSRNDRRMPSSVCFG